MAARSSEKPWEQQKGESSQAFEAFRCYLEIKSIRKVAEKLGKSDTLMSRWSSKWKWVEREKAYTKELFRRDFEEKKTYQKNMYKRQIKIAEMMQKKAFDALKELSPEDIFTKDIIRLFTEGVRIESEAVQNDISVSTSDLGMNNGSDSLADTIVNAYKKRMEDE